MYSVLQKFDTEDKAIQWFEEQLWPDKKISCLRCGSLEAYRVKSGKPLPYRCRDCKRYFSLKTETAMENSPLPLRVWAIAIWLETTHPKGISSMQLHRMLGVKQSTAWHMLHRIRTAFEQTPEGFTGPVEVDETWVGGLEKNRHR